MCKEQRILEKVLLFSVFNTALKCAYYGSQWQKEGAEMFLKNWGIIEKMSLSLPSLNKEWKTGFFPNSGILTQVFLLETSWLQP